MRPEAVAGVEGLEVLGLSEADSKRLRAARNLELFIESLEVGRRSGEMRRRSGEPAAETRPIADAVVRGSVGEVTSSLTVGS